VKWSELSELISELSEEVKRAELTIELNEQMKWAKWAKKLNEKKWKKLNAPNKFYDSAKLANDLDKGMNHVNWANELSDNAGYMS
jgi:hypothetical protein